MLLPTARLATASYLDVLAIQFPDFGVAPLSGEHEMRRQRRVLSMWLASPAVLLLAAVVTFLRYTEGGVSELLRDPQYQNRRTEKLIPDFGLVSYAALYTASHNKRRIAEVLRQSSEVEVAAFEEHGSVHALGPQGAAQIDYNARNGGFRCQTTGRDPLQIGEVLEQRKDLSQSADGFFADRLWFDALKSHHYPDAVFRLYEAMTGLVRNKADVLVSFREGYFWGNWAFEEFSRFVRIWAFHGGLQASQSEAFFMSTAKQAPPYLRSQDLIEYF
jgi:hypothetical protein